MNTGVSHNYKFNVFGSHKEDLERIARKRADEYYGNTPYCLEIEATPFPESGYEGPAHKFRAECEASHWADEPALQAEPSMQEVDYEDGALRPIPTTYEDIRDKEAL